MFFGKQKNRSILKSVIIIIILMLIILLVINYYNTINNRLDREACKYVEECTIHGANVVSYRINPMSVGVINMASTLSSGLFDSKEAVMAYMKQQSGYFTMLYIGIADSEGIVHMADGQQYSVAEEPEFQKAMAGEVCVSEPFQRDGTDKAIITLNCPIYQESKVVSYIRAEMAVDLIKKMILDSISWKNGTPMIVNREGEILIYFGESAEEQSKFDYIEKISEEFTCMEAMSEKQGAGTLNIDGRVLYVGYARIPEYKDWFFLSIMPVEEAAENIRVVLNASKRLIQGVLIFAVISLTVIYILEAKEHRITRQLAYTDSLTGLANRNRFMELASRIIQRKNGYQCAIITFDINRFSYVNSIFDFERGNDLLKLVAESLQQDTEGEEICARSNDDIFFLLLFCNTKEEVRLRMDHILNDIQKRAREILPNFQLTFSCGIRLIEDRYLSLDQILDRANYAREYIKGELRDTVTFFDKELQEKKERAQMIETQMKYALEQNEFQVFIQPKINFKTEKIVGGEALVRWQSEKFGFISPNDFIEIFERNGFVLELDYYMLEKVCRQIKDWEARGVPLYPISVNFSQLHLYEDDFVEKLLEICKSYQVQTKYIELEMTERTLSGKNELLLPLIEQLHKEGFLISMDDFGTGISSLSVLKEIPVDAIKIDKSFLDGENTLRSQLVIGKIIELGKALDMLVIAEGVETKEQKEFLKTHQCDVAQGFYYAKPMPLKDYEHILVSRQLIGG